ncbi:MAG: extracellular solute-binding protein [Anaerolineae bacterium]|nr:extracellular solute-binding protein [Anaerolineae bacterium]
MTVTVVGDAGHNLMPYEFWKDDFTAMGINIEIVEVPFADVYQVLKTEFVAGTGAFDVVTFYPAYIGDFASNGYLMPLDDFMAQEPAVVWDPNQDDVLAPFRELYNKFGGQTYALTIDGDVLVLQYRTDLFRAPGRTGRVHGAVRPRTARAGDLGRVAGSRRVLHAQGRRHAGRRDPGTGLLRPR